MQFLDLHSRVYAKIIPENRFAASFVKINRNISSVHGILAKLLGLRRRLLRMLSVKDRVNLLTRVGLDSA